jgi:hypothetical protein
MPSQPDGCHAFARAREPSSVGPLTPSHARRGIWEDREGHVGSLDVRSELSQPRSLVSEALLVAPLMIAIMVGPTAVTQPLLR